MDETWILAHLGPADVVILAWQMGLFVITLSIFALMKRTQLSLITTYLFTLYWGFYFYWGNYIASAGASTIPVLVYASFGILQAALTAFAFYQESPKASSPEGEKQDISIAPVSKHLPRTHEVTQPLLSVQRRGQVRSWLFCSSSSILRTLRAILLCAPTLAFIFKQADLTDKVLTP